NLMGAGGDHLVVGDGGVVAQQGERCSGAGHAVGRARAGGVAIGAQGQSELELGIYPELVLEIDAEAVEGQRLRIADGEVLSNAVRKTVGKIKHARLNGRIAAFAGGEVADVIAPEVAAELQGVLAAFDREIVHQLPLGDVAALRENGERREGAGARAERSETAVKDVQNVGESGKCRIEIGALEKRRVVENRPDEVVYDAGVENVRVVELAFVLRLVALNVEDRIDRIGVSRLVAAVELDAAEDLVIVGEVVVHAAAQEPFAVAVRHRDAVGGEAPAA